jgi:hypothetical protein
MTSPGTPAGSPSATAKSRRTRRLLAGAAALSVGGSAVLLLYPSGSAAAPIGGGGASRTWVSGVGDDANPCSRTAPCKTFAGAISKTAAGGEINVLDPGGFGAVNITKAITITAEGVEGGVLTSYSNGIVVAAGPNDVVVLRGLDLDGTGTGLNGIKFSSGKALHVENTTINNFTQAGIDVVNATGYAYLYVDNLTVRDNLPAGGSAIRLHPSGTGKARAYIDNSQFVNNDKGLWVEQDGTAVLRDTSIAGSPYCVYAGASSADHKAEVTVDDSSFGFCTTSAVYATGAGAKVFLTEAQIAGSAAAVKVASSGQVVSFGNNAITDTGNATGTQALE